MDENNKEDLEKQELELKKTLEQISETNKKIDDAYDEKIKRLENKKKLLPDEKEEDMHSAKITALKEKLNEIKARISEARKNGKDPFIADLWLRNVNAKIKIAEVTNDQKDYQIVENILNNAELELKDTLKQEEVNVKKEIEAKLRQNIAKETGKVTDNEEEY